MRPGAQAVAKRRSSGSLGTAPGATDTYGVLEFGVLGPLRVVDDDGELRLGGVKQRAVLARLLVSRGRVVSSDELIEAVWGPGAEERSRRSLQVYVSNLRRLLARGEGEAVDRIKKQGPGYALVLGRDQLDLARFERLVSEGRAALAADRPNDAQVLLENALALWRGRALADFPYLDWAQLEAGRLEELRLAALEDRIEAELALGRHGELIAELEAMAAEHPYRERVHAQLMLALYRSGRQAEALAVYAEARRAFVDELGIEPGPALRELERAVLAQDPSLATPLRRDGARLPSGTVTFLFTDIEGSTRLLRELGAERYAEALAEHRRAVREACAPAGGVEVDTQGDSFFVAFPTAPGALEAARAITREPVEPVRVRMGVHTGMPLVTDQGYVGEDVHRAARIAAAGHGGQVLVSGSTAPLVDAELRDLGEHRLKDLSAPIRLYQLGDREFPPLRTLYRSNLPVPANPLVGREDELLDVVRLLAHDGARIVTVTGPGGVGKTRFAVAAGGQASDAFPDGVWFVPLSPLRDAALVLPTVANAVGADGELAQHLGDDECLLVLDNLEQVIEAAVDLAGLVAECPRLRVLVTSREALRIAQEREFALSPLPEAPSVELLRQRSAAVAPDLEIEYHLAAALCERLDGLPLAIELAAARCRALSPAQILERLAQRLDLLEGGRRDSDPRQRTLRATIEWSHELLSEDERQLFSRLSVFAGGCTLEAAEAVCGADLDTLQSLVEKSLLRFTDERFWMLETIRQYAAERLDLSGELDSVRHSHLDLVLALAAELDAAHGADADLLERFARERDNFRAALTWASSSGRRDAQLDLVGLTSVFWADRGHLAEGRAWVEAAVLASDGERTARRAKVLLAGARFATRLGDVDGLGAFAAESLGIARDVGDSRDLALALNAVGLAAVERAEYDEAERYLQEAIALAHELGDRSLAAMAINSMGDLALRQRDFDRAIPFLEEALAISRAVGEGEGTAVALYNLAHALLRGKRRPEAESAARESLELAVRIESTHTVVWDLLLLAAAARLRGEAEPAATLLGAAHAQCERTGLELRGAEADLHDETVDGLAADLGATRYEAAIARGRVLSLEQAVALGIG